MNLLTLILAQTVDIPAAPEVLGPVAPNVGSTLLNMLLSPAGIGGLATLIGGVLALVFGANEVRRRRVAMAVYHAFHVVEDISKETDTDVDDKVAAGLKALDAYMLANGWRALKPGEVELAKLGFSALNGSEKVQTKIQAAAIEAATKAVAVPPPAS